MAFNMLNLADTYGAGERAKQDAQEFQSRNALADLQRQYLGQRMEADAAAAKRDEQKFSQEQQVANTKMLNAAAAEVARDPQAIGRWLPQLEQAGIIQPGTDWRNADPEQVRAGAQRIFESTSAALASLGGGQNGPKIGAFNPGDYTPESFARFQQSGNAADLRRYVAPRDNGPDAPKPRDVMALRKEFDGQQSVKDFKTALPLLVSARKAPDNGYGDLQLIYTAGKVLDPGSVVREGELTLTLAAGSPLQRVLGTTRFSLEQGGRLTPQVRQQLLGMLNERVLAYRQAHDQERQRYEQYAAGMGVDPSVIIGAHPANAYPRSNAPQKPQASGGWSVEEVK